MSPGAPEWLKTLAPLVASVVLLSRQSQCIVVIGVGLNGIGTIFGQPNHDGDQKIFGVMTLIFH